MWLTVVLALFRYVTLKTVSHWSLMTDAVFRYVTVCRPLSVAVQVASLSRARLAVALVVVGSVVLCSPNYLLYAPVPLALSHQCNSALYPSSPVPLGDRPGFWIDYNRLIQPVHMVSAI